LVPSIIQLQDAGHDAEAARVGLACRQGVVDPVTLPRRRDDQDPVDPGLVHQVDALLVGEGGLAVPVEPHALAGAGDPGAVGGLFFPDVDLSIDNEHGGVTFLRC
jgi:hypothetical protein